jgi:DNA-directed RNA polymerase specialized sigma24 family protein
MTEPDEFDQFYKDVRTRLLLLTYCLTGDLPASRAAVRDAFVVAWHHWRKVSRVEDPEAWVREHACRHAVRRHTAKLWHREKNLDPDIKATLDALGRLPMTQRRVLLVTELTTSSLAAMSREVGLPRTEAERELQTATATFALHREVGTTEVRSILEAVREHVETNRWPRPTILRRAGATRRRTHTVIGVAATAAALVIAGTLVTDADGVRPTLAGERIEADGPSGSPTPEVVDVPEDSLLGADSLSRLVSVPDGKWMVASTDDNSDGNGKVVTCQQSRYASPRNRPDAALVRVFDPQASDQNSALTSTKKAAPKTKTTVVQTAESSRNERAAGRAYDTAATWFAGCHEDRAQLLATYDLPGVGDEAHLFELRTWSAPETTIVAGVARTGSFTTTTVSTTRAADGPRPAAVAKVLARGVDQLCALPEGGTCSTSAKPQQATPVPVAQAPGMLAEVDLPPAAGVSKPWVGTEPRKALANAAATHCDDTDFSAAPMSNNLTRTFLVPEAKLAAEFGLTESVGTLPPKRAKAFVADVRAALGRCSKKQMGTTVTRLRDVRRGNTDLSVWRVTTEVTDDKTLSFLMGIVRDGTAVAQVGFVPVKGVTIAPDAFERLTQRALDRLAEMPAPR